MAIFWRIEGRRSRCHDRRRNSRRRRRIRQVWRGRRPPSLRALAARQVAAFFDTCAQRQDAQDGARAGKGRTAAPRTSIPLQRKLKHEGRWKRGWSDAIGNDAAGRRDQAEAWRRLLGRRDGAAAMVGDVRALREHLDRDGDAATRRGGPRGWDALLYLCKRPARLARPRTRSPTRTSTVADPRTHARARFQR
jgi:hypothetical protein